MLRHLDLFSGIGGFALAARMVGGYETVAFCEIDPFCRAVLRKHWPAVPIHEDVRRLGANDAGPADIITGGFPCQDISSSGEKAGIDGVKSGLWREQRRLIRELRPPYVLLKNVADLLYRGLGVVLGELAEIGYDAEWHCVPASYCGLPQARDRIWIVAYPGGGGREGGDERLAPGPPRIRWAHDDRLGQAQHRALDGAARTWRVDDGIPGRVDRLRSLGNSIVPQVAAIFLQAIKEAMT